MIAATTATVHAAPSSPPDTVINPFDAAAHSQAQQAATEGRLERLAEYTIAGPSVRLSFLNVVSGLLGFVSFIVAVPLTVTGALAHGDHTGLELTGGVLGVLIVLNVVGGYLMSIAHQALHVLLCRSMGGNATVTKVDQYIYRWRAAGQAFSRHAYLVVLLTPFVVVTLLWLLILLIAPTVAAFLIVPLVVSSVASGADLWLAWAVHQHPAKAELFVDTQQGFITYSVIAAKSPRKKVATRPTTAHKHTPTVKH